MLVVSRKVGESIQISDNIHVTVSNVKGGRVRICIDAPRSIPVVRQERHSMTEESTTSSCLDVTNQAD